MGIGAAIVGSAVVGGAAQAWGAKKSADAQKSAANTSAAVQREMFYQSREDQLPWLETGEGALNQLAGLYGVEGGDPNAMQKFTQSPGYQFRLNQGVDAIENSAAARGTLNSGNTLRGLMEYGQNFASNEFNNYSNRLAALAGVGQSTATNIAGQSANTAAGIGSAVQNAGAARASGYAGMANAVGNTTNQLSMLYGMQNGGVLYGMQNGGVNLQGQPAPIYNNRAYVGMM